MNLFCLKSKNACEYPNKRQYKAKSTFRSKFFFRNFFFSLFGHFSGGEQQARVQQPIIHYQDWCVKTQSQHLNYRPNFPNLMRSGSLSQVFTHQTGTDFVATTHTALSSATQYLSRRLIRARLLLKSDKKSKKTFEKKLISDSFQASYILYD